MRSWMSTGKLPSPTSSRITGSWLSNTIPIKILKKRRSRCSFKFNKPIRCFLIPTREPGTITTERRSSSTRTRWAKKTWKCILLGSTFGNFSLHRAIRDTRMKMEETSIKYTGRFSRESKSHKGKHINMTMTAKRNLEGSRGSETVKQVWRRCWSSMKTGTTWLRISHSYGSKNGTPKRHRIDGWGGRCRKRTRSRGKKRKSSTLRQLRTWYRI